MRLFKLTHDVPSHLGAADESRTVLEIFGLRLAWSTYKVPVRPRSGAAIGIRRSFWMFTDHWAYGTGEIADWANLDRLEIRIGQFSPVCTETGNFDLHPPVEVEPKHKLYIHLQNRNAVDATGVLKLYEIVDRGGAGHLAIVDSLSFAVLAAAGKLTSIEAQPWARRVDRVMCDTWISDNFREGRIYGRPEWLS